MKSLPLPVVLKVFDTYVLPILTYCLSVWADFTISSSSRNMLNAVFTKFLKRYLGVPYLTKTAIVYYITNTYPLVNELGQLLLNASLNVRYPSTLSGVKIKLCERKVLD